MWHSLFVIIGDSVNKVGGKMSLMKLQTEMRLKNMLIPNDVIALQSCIGQGIKKTLCIHRGYY